MSECCVAGLGRLSIRRQAASEPYSARDDRSPTPARLLRA